MATAVLLLSSPPSTLEGVANGMSGAPNNGSPPRCKKCGHDHWNMLDCIKLQTPSVQLRRPRLNDEGRVLDWGNRLETIVAVSGDRVVGRARRPMHSETA